MIDVTNVEIMFHLDSQIYVFLLSTLFHSGKRIKGSSTRQLPVNSPGRATSNSQN
jgi:hypothetical protein